MLYLICILGTWLEVCGASQIGGSAGKAGTILWPLHTAYYQSNTKLVELS